MTRTDNDTWDLASSVGVTATGVAVGRALASRGTDPLINDPFAEPLVRAVGVDFFTRIAGGELDLAEVDGEATFGMRGMADMMAVRTRFIDEFFMEAADAGIRQVVILASGLDARAYRLPWPAGMTVYEIDQPQVTEFKTKTMGGIGADPLADRRAIGMDLRHDWPSALREAGFDAAQPTAWSAEGLLMYLPPDAQDRLLDNIIELSAAGSRFVSENMTNLSEAETLMRNQLQEATERWREHGFDQDMADLWYFEDRNDVVDYLKRRGWETEEAIMADLYVANRISLPASDDDEAALFHSFSYVTATRA